MTYKALTPRLLNRAVGWTNEFQSPYGELMALMVYIIAAFVLFPVLLFDIAVLFGSIMQHGTQRDGE